MNRKSLKKAEIIKIQSKSLNRKTSMNIDVYRDNLPQTIKQGKNIGKLFFLGKLYLLLFFIKSNFLVDITYFLFTLLYYFC